jgi:small subunit ribosomal protein S1
VVVDGRRRESGTLVVPEGVGFITYPELSWTRFESASDIVQVGQRVTCEFLQFDTWNGEARLSLRALLPDPFEAFADGTAADQGASTPDVSRSAVGRTLRGRSPGPALPVTSSTSA